MKDKEEAIKLSKQMNKIGNLAGKEIICIITNMDEPLGSAVGNNLEVIEAIEALKGNMKEDVKEVVLELGAHMINLAGINKDINKNKEMILENIKNGKAYNKFMELVKKQGGDVSYIEDISKFEKSKHIIPVTCPKEGFVKEINARKIGEISGMLGAGRVRKEDKIDQTVGVILCKKISDTVKKDDIIAYVHANNKELAKKACKNIQDVYKIDNKKIEKPDIILGIVK